MKKNKFGFIENEHNIIINPNKIEKGHYSSGLISISIARVEKGWIGSYSINTTLQGEGSGVHTIHDTAYATESECINNQISAIRRRLETTYKNNSYTKSLIQIVDEIKNEKDQISLLY